LCRPALNRILHGSDFRQDSGKEPPIRQIPLVSIRFLWQSEDLGQYETQTRKITATSDVKITYAVPQQLRNAAFPKSSTRLMESTGSVGVWGRTVFWCTSIPKTAVQYGRAASLQPIFLVF